MKAEFIFGLRGQQGREVHKILQFTSTVQLAGKKSGQLLYGLEIKVWESKLGNIARQELVGGIFKISTISQV